ncbi:putative glutamine--tRNA ligase [Ceratocystis fimbriata CBS 114723]|uniref:glutamine--tRNA ligase n=1 Tax=Ceratocystis fimbriata CBS 114723 TaxID=1035309 RepID=A0A2C5WXU1_9PEZI|nr:putative glutamine--tRNA ligase [Ceratocystis fimbriata CBS 114723]
MSESPAPPPATAAEATSTASPVAEVTASVAKLVLDEETGEMVSKNELKKRMQKRSKKAAAAQHKAKAAAEKKPEGAKANKPAKKEATEAESPLDPDAMFKQGFLADVFNIRPMKPVITRFPPEPNGYLHLGHAKAIAINFGFARYHGGKTILRFDDTNPDAEEEKYFTAIKEMITWLGFQPAAITHSSDNFQKLYDLAEKLIDLGKAYVCHCDAAAIKIQRGGENGSIPRTRCEHAETDKAVNLAKFRDMRDGKYAPQTAVLRMKQDIVNNNPQMWDLAAYRIPKNQTHHVRTGDKWKIYPTYDFTHGLCDSFENITHSLCTTEFVLSRESYEWLNTSLGVYEPMQREYGRLNVAGTVMSKRALRTLVEQGYVRGWDDPRLYTLIAIRRRGIPPGAILSFINELGVTTAKSVIQIARFEQAVRKYLETTVPRLMLVLDPVPLVIEDIGDLENTELELPFSPKDPKMGSHKVTLSKTLYIDRSDFREEDSKGYFRLAPNKSVGLLQLPFPVKAVSYSKDEATGKVTEIRAVFDRDGKKPKTYIQWVGAGARPAEVRIYKQLFKSDDPMTLKEGYLSDINPDSETIWPAALVESGIADIKQRAPWPATEGEQKKASAEGVTAPAPETVRFQGMRVAYFAMDPDSTEEKLVLNQIVSLKEDSGK